MVFIRITLLRALLEPIRRTIESSGISKNEALHFGLVIISTFCVNFFLVLPFVYRSYTVSVLSFKYIIVNCLKKKNLKVGSVSPKFQNIAKPSKKQILSIPKYLLILYQVTTFEVAQLQGYKCFPN